MGRPTTVAAEDRSVALRYYHATKDRRHDAIKASNIRAYQKRMRRLYDWLLQHPCVDCGEPDPVVLTFDHVRGTKQDTVSNLIRHHGWAAVKAELAKCEVRCANCHARRHARQRGFYAYVISEEVYGA